MKIIFGLALLSAAILLIVYIGKLKRLPDGPKWASSMFVLNPAIFVTVTGIAFGAALAIDGVASIRSTGFGMLEVGLLGGIAALTVLFGFGIRRMGKSAARREKWATGVAQNPVGIVPSS